MAYIKSFVWLSAGLMMLAIALFFGRLYLTLDSREAELIGAVKATGNSLTFVVNSKLEEIRGDLKDEISPVTRAATNTLGAGEKTLAASSLAMIELQGKLNSLDVDELNAAVKSADTSITAAGSLADRYSALPDQIHADREYQGLVAETMGVLGGTKVTMGQIAKASKTFEDRFPSLMDSGQEIAQSADGIASDVKREADQLTKPQTFWGGLRVWLLTLARIIGAI